MTLNSKQSIEHKLCTKYTYWQNQGLQLRLLSCANLELMCEGERALLLICDFRDLNACVFSHASFPLLWYARLAGLGVITIF